MSSDSVESNLLEDKNFAYEQYYEEAKEEFRKIEQSKKKIINDLAKKLEESDMKLELVCSEICRNLEGFASERYIRESLDEKYKELKKKNKPKEKKKVDAALPPHIQVSNTGQELFNPEPIQPKEDIGIPTKDDWRPPPDTKPTIQEEKDFQENEDFKKFREEKAINEDLFIPPNRFTKLVIDLMKVKTTAQKTGAYITKDLEVKV